MNYKLKNTQKYFNIRRSFIITIILFFHFVAPLSASWKKQAFESKSISDSLLSLYNSSTLIQTDKITLKLPGIAENGAVVPLSIQSNLDDVTEMTIFVDKNPNPLVAIYNFSHVSLIDVNTRIKMSQTANVIIVVKAGGKLYTTKKFVKVTVGGCGGDGGGGSSAYYTPNSFRSMPVSTEKYQSFKNNDIVATSEQRTSTFSIDVDTGAYSNIRRMISLGQQPPKDAVRVEEMINYFDYNYRSPSSEDKPFSVITEISQSPWNQNNHLVHIGIKSYKVSTEKLPATNVVFLLDVSGSMHAANKLPLLLSSIKLLAKQLRKQDRIAIVVYAGAAGMVLAPTAGNNYNRIIEALDKLRAGGSTNGGQGIQLAYKLAQQSFIKNGINRVILGTDGDFNVGMTSNNALIALIEKYRKTGIYLTTLGFGTGNYNDALMEQLADKGNGNYAYIDSMNEANKVFVQQISATLHTIAKDVKIQMEFNPNVVAEYRLIGYENRVLENKDFKNDKIDAGEIGSGHTVTALYEITLINSPYRALEPQRYGKKVHIDVNKNEIGMLRIRYKQPDSETSTIKSWVLKSSDILDISKSSNNYRFSAAVAAAGQLLRESSYIESFSLNDVVKLANNAKGTDNLGYRNEFIQMLRLYSKMDK